MCLSAKSVFDEDATVSRAECASINTTLPLLHVPKPSVGLLSEIAAEFFHSNETSSMRKLLVGRTYVWTNNHDAAIGLRRQLRREMVSLNEAAHLRLLLTFAMKDAVTFQGHPVPARVSVGFGTYGYNEDNNFSVRYFGSAGTELTIGRFCSIAGKVIVYLDGNHQTTFVSM